MLEEKVVLRGDVWWISAGTSSDWEQNFGRPAVVISGDVGNERMPMVMVAFVTTSSQRKPSPIYPKIVFPEGERRVLCNQVYTVDKSRLDRKICTLTESEMVRVGGALAVAMCIPQYPKNPQIEKSGSEDTMSLRCEVDMWRKMYEKTMDQLVELRINTTIARLTDRAMEPVLEPVLSEEAPKSVFKSALPEPDLGYEEESNNEEKTRPTSKQRVRNKVEWDGVKVNVNTVKTATELKNRTGMAMHTAVEIVRTRKIVGAYEKLEDLLALDKFGEIAMKRYGHMLEV